MNTVIFLKEYLNMVKIWYTKKREAKHSEIKVLSLVKGF